MTYQFYKLAQVETNNSVTDETYALVVNGDQVQKAKSDLMGSGFYKDFTEDYYNDQRHRSILDYVKDLPISLLDPRPYTGYIVGIDGEYCVFEVSGTGADTKVHARYYSVVDNTKKDVKIVDYYNGTLLQSEEYYVDNNKIYEIISSDNLSVDGNLYIEDNATINKNLTINEDEDLFGTLRVKKSLEHGITEIENNDIRLSYYDGRDHLHLEQDESLGLKIYTEGGYTTYIDGISLLTGNSLSDKNKATSKEYVDNIKRHLEGQIQNVRDVSFNVRDVEFKSGPAYTIFSKLATIGELTSEGIEISTTFSDYSADTFPIGVKCVISNGLQPEETRFMTSDYIKVETEGNTAVYTSYVSFTESASRLVLVSASFIYAEVADVINITDLKELCYPFSYENDPLEWDPDDVPYDEGDFVTKDGNVYVCIVANTDSTWVPSHWTRSTPRYILTRELENVLKADGSVVLTGNLDMGNNRIIRVSDPVADADAANKGFVNSKGMLLSSSGILSWG